MNDIDPERYWRHDLDPFLIEFGSGFGIRYYGLAYALGFLVAIWLLREYARRGRTSLDPAQRSDFFLILVLGVLLGGRLGYFLFYSGGDWLREPWAVFKVWEGGMASHGAFVGVAAGLWIAARRFGTPFWHLADIACSLAPPGILLGRVANFINGELWGRVATVPWAVRFPDAPDRGLLPRHPSQLYEAGLEGLIPLLYLQWRVWRTPVLAREPGRLAGEFLFGYAILRIVGEQFREPDAHIGFDWLGLTRGTWLSLLLAIAGLLVIWRARRRTAE